MCNALGIKLMAEILKLNLQNIYITVFVKCCAMSKS